MRRYANYQPSPAMRKALEEIKWKIPSAMIKARKDCARGILRGDPNLYAKDYPIRIAQRYARFLAHRRAKQNAMVEVQRAQLVEVPPDVAMGGGSAINAYLRVKKETV